MKRSEDAFIKKIWDFYKMNKRPMPWRIDTSPYSIFISEVMLQQTQVARVLIKYPIFLHAFPNFKSLACADTQKLLSAWQGMGYNRRALYLRAAAAIIEEKYKGILPKDTILLDELPGIGYATACSIAAFAFNMPVPFIETNIRRVYIHHFFTEGKKVDDKDILALVSKTVDKNNPREWYWALMDYGAHLAKQGENPNKRSSHYSKQKKFRGSIREIRGGILRLLLRHTHSQKELEKVYADERLFTVLEQLIKEGFIMKDKDKFKIL